jgi:hypothetical protein
MKSRLSGLVLLLLFITPGSLLAQGLFQGAGLPQSVTATGQTELIGPIVVSMTQGPAGAGTLVVDVSPLQLTNANASDIRVTPAGITVGATTIDTTNNLVQIPVQATANPTASIRIEGIRVAVAGTGITSANAKLSWQSSLNVFTGGTTVPVINGVQSALVAQPITDPFLIFNGQVYRSTSTIHVAEGFASAFSSSSQFGQTGPTRIRVRVTDFPDGLQMTFPATVTANESGATLTTIGGAPVILPAGGGDNTVTYAFTGAANSDPTTESFDIKFSVAVTGPLSDLQPTFEVSLAPIGAAIPNSTFPSTDIPRYAEDEILVQAGTSRTITKVLYWTGINTALQNQVHVTNPSSRVSNLTIDAFNSAGQAISGTGVTNPLKLSLPAHQSLVRSVADLFGTAAGVASIRVQSTSPDVLAVAVVSGNGVDEAVQFVSRPIASGFLPVVKEGAQFQFMNPTSNPVTGTVTLRTEAGQTVATKQVTLAPLASATVAVQSAFNTTPQSGYASAVFSDSIILFETFGEANLLNLFAAQPPASVDTLFIPFTAGGSGFQTDVSLINVSDQTVTLTAKLFTGSGTQSGSTQSITMKPGEQLASSVQQMFSQSPATGYVRVEVPLLYKGFFGYYPTIAGLARVRSTQGGTTVVPLSVYPLADAFVLGDGTSAGGFEGIALVNPTASNVSVNLQALNLDGTVAATAAVTLTPGQVFSQLTTQLFNGGLPAQTVIRVTASTPIAITAISGTTALDQFRALPVLR